MYPGLRGVLKYQPRNALRRSGGPGGVRANATGGRRRCVAQIRSAVVQRSWQGARARPWPRGQTPGCGLVSLSSLSGFMSIFEYFVECHLAE